MARSTAFILTILLVPLAAHAADDARVNFLEQEVRRLQQEVLTMTRRLDALERPVSVTQSAPPRAPSPMSDSETWLDAGKWKKLRAGMSELEVLSLLGPPTSTREVDGANVLFYAREIGGSGFIGGSVKLRNRVVVEVQQPVLR